MSNIAWLESIALMTNKNDINSILKNQPLTIQNAYAANDQHAVRALLGGTTQQAVKNTIFTL